MGTICPKDFKPCIDDICRGSDSCALTGTELFDVCAQCHQVYSYDYDIECACDDRDDDSEAD